MCPTLCPLLYCGCARAHLPWRWSSGTVLVHGGWVDALGEAEAQAEMPVSGRAPMLTPMLTAMLSACSPISRGDAAVRARGLSAASMSLSSAAARRRPPRAEAARARGGAARCGAVASAVAGRALRAARLPGGPGGGTACGGGDGRSPAPMAGLADCGRDVGGGRRGGGDGCLNGVGGSAAASGSVGAVIATWRRMLGDGARDEPRESRGRGPPCASQADANSPAIPLPPPAWAGTGERPPEQSPGAGFSMRTRVPSLPNIT